MLSAPVPPLDEGCIRLQGDTPKFRISVPHLGEEFLSKCLVGKKEESDLAWPCCVLGCLGWIKASSMQTRFSFFRFPCESLDQSV